LIISRTPYRISFAGGLSDLEAYYKYQDGHVVSTTIDKYLYLFVTKNLIGKYRAVYRNVEEVDEIDDIKHPLVRECLKMAKIDEPVEIMCLSDAPGGTGLGSSSAFTVGLLNALYRYNGIQCNKAKLAEDACKIEIDILGEPIGKQDQYNCAFGGLNHYVFTKKRIRIHPILADIETINRLQDNLMLFYTNIQRKASDILNNQKKNMHDIVPIVKDMTWMASCISSDLHHNTLDNIGAYIGEEWNLKKKTGNVSNEMIDEIIDRTYDAGATGAKLCGAGSGGFLMVYCEPAYQDAVRKRLSDLTEFPFRFDEHGSRIIHA